MKTKNLFWGILFILLGAFLLLGKYVFLDFFSISKLWPFFVLVPGLAFEASYFLDKKNAGILVPGGILTTIGLLFFFETYTNWSHAGYTWPIYILAVAIGLFQLYYFGGRQKGLLIPVFILTLVAAVSAFTMLSNSLFKGLDFTYFIAIIFILLGIYLLISKNSKANNKI